MSMADDDDQPSLSVHQAAEILSVKATATPDEVTAAWRKAVRRYHPDHNPGDPKLARQKFDQVQEAYQILSDPRVAASRELATANAPQPPFASYELEAFRVLGLGPRATYDEIDRVAMDLLGRE